MAHNVSFATRRKIFNFSERYYWFMHSPWAGGVMLVVFMVLALVLGNLPATKGWYYGILQSHFTIGFDGFALSKSIEHWINDGLMVIFFFYVGLEIKREIIAGELSSPRQAAMPIAAAVGGMLFPAAIYLVFNHGNDYASGWGIPMATDIAFAIGVLSLLGNRVPLSLKVFLTALAIVDDLGAILVIALFYGEEVNLLLLAIAILILVGIYFLNKVGETRIMFYLVPAFVVWALFYYSGIHSTLSGVVIAMFIPMKPRYSKEYFARKMSGLSDALLKAECRADDFPNEEHRYYLRMMSSLATDSVGMSFRLEHLLAPYVTFLIMPIFAFANAGVSIDSLEYFRIFHVTPQAGAVGTGIFFGLLVGKPLGIFLASWLAVKTKLAEMPEGAGWKMLFAVACLGGIGFTMSIFVDTLAFADAEIVSRGKIAILMGSFASAVLGTVLIFLFSKKKTRI